MKMEGSSFVSYRMTAKEYLLLQKRKQKNPKSYSHIRQGWWTNGERWIYMRSHWEANYARYLDFLKHKLKEIEDWEYEPQTFWFEGVRRGCVSYKPDFRVKYNDGHVEYHEVKGHMDNKSKTKLRRMKKHFPNVIVKVISTKRMVEIRKFSHVIDRWDYPLMTVTEKKRMCKSV